LVSRTSTTLKRERRTTTDRPADFVLGEQAGRLTVALSGDWTATSMGDAGERLWGALRGRAVQQVELAQLGRFDTAGAYALHGGAGQTAAPAGLEARPEVARLYELVGKSVAATLTPPPARRPFRQLLVKIGRGLLGFFGELMELLTFVGRLIVTLLRFVVQPWKLRWAPIFNQMDRAGLDAMPIVCTLSFFVGAVVALIGANLLAQFGATVFIVELIGVAVLREFGVLITAILLAGRSASSFAAEIGSMRMNQEIDAMEVIGVDPYEALVAPRLIALMLMTPLLTLGAVLAGLAGGMAVAWTALQLSPVFFLDRIITNVGVTQFLIGLVKAPVFAVVIASIGCRQGLQVEGDVESLGLHVTTAVVQAIFAIIVIDAAFALVFLELNV
jgi:phospholipid/cholesterol/gamma-HCH transport system permease protein